MKQMRSWGHLIAALAAAIVIQGPTWVCAEEAGEAEAQPEAESERPSGVSDAMVRLGRIEMVLIQNEDPISAAEFAMAALEQDGDNARLRMLLAACAMNQNLPADALEHYVRAIRLSEQSDPETHLHALYGLARAFQYQNQLEQAAVAYDHYVTFAQAHPELESFVDIAQRLALVLRDRARAGR